MPGKFTASTKSAVIGQKLKEQMMHVKELCKHMEMETTILFKRVRGRGGGTWGGGAFSYFGQEGGHFFGGGCLLESGRLFGEIQYYNQIIISRL